MRALTVLDEEELYAAAKDHQAPYELIRMVAEDGQAAGAEFFRGRHRHSCRRGADDAVGRGGVFVGSGIFMKEGATPLDVELDAEGKVRNPKEREEAESRAKAIVIATTHYNDPKILAEVSEQVTGSMKGLAIAGLDESQLLQTRGW